MDTPLSSASWWPGESLRGVKPLATVLLLALFWCWETCRPFHASRPERGRHAARNLALAIVNNVLLGLLFATLSLLVLDVTARHGYGLLNAIPFPSAVQLALGLVLLDGWMYVWHRANHAVPMLWRFHRVHHSDTQMDVTTATRFHLGEHVAALVLRLTLIPLLGLTLLHLVVYDALVIAVTQFHHADISLGRADRWLRWLIVTPDMHKVHHSDWQPETDSNYSTILSLWDRLAGSFRMRQDVASVVFGLAEYSDPSWQTLPGMLKTPFVDPASKATEPPGQVRLRERARSLVS